MMDVLRIGTRPVFDEPWKGFKEPIPFDFLVVVALDFFHEVQNPMQSPVVVFTASMLKRGSPHSKVAEPELGKQHLGFSHVGVAYLLTGKGMARNKEHTLPL